MSDNEATQKVDFRSLFSHEALPGEMRPAPLPGGRCRHDTVELPDAVLMHGPVRPQK